MKGRGYVPAPGRNDKRIATSGLKPEVAQRIYDDVREKVIAEFDQRKAALDAKGVFDASVNAVRAETQMQVAIEKRYKRALQAAAGDGKGDGTSSHIPPPRPLRESPAPAAGNTTRARRAREAAARSRRSQSALAMASMSATATDPAAKNATLAERLESLQAEVAATGHVSQQRRPTSAGTVDGAAPHAAGTTPTAAALPPVRRTAKVLVPGGSPSAFGGSKSPGAGRSPGLAGVDGAFSRSASGDGRQHHRDDSPEPDDGTAMPAAAATTAAGSGVASFLQQTLEHSEYADLEAEERALAKRRDEKLREPDPVDRYTTPWLAKHPEKKAWATSAATLTAEEMAIGADARKEAAASAPRRWTSPDGAARAGSPPANESSRHVDKLERAAVARESRLRHRVDAGRQLAAQHDLMSPALHFNDELGGGAKSPVSPGADNNIFTSSDDDDGAAEDEAGSSALLAKARQAGPEAAQQRRAEEACDLVECTIVCLSELSAAMALGGGGGTAKPLGPAPIQRDRHILRNVLLNGLHDLLFVVRDELKRRKHNRSAQTADDLMAESKGARSGNAPQSTTMREAPPYAYRALRSWAKGVEVLLAMALSLPPGMPFSARNPDHVEGMVRHYCAKRLVAERHSAALLAKWRREAELQRGVSAVTAAGGDNESKDGKLAMEGSHRAWSEDAEEVLRALRSTASVPLQHIAKLSAAEAPVRFKQREVAAAFLHRFRDLLPPPEGRVNQSGNEPTSPAGANRSTPAAQPTSPGGRSTSPASTSASRLKAILLRYAGVRDPAAPPPSQSANLQASSAGALGMSQSTAGMLTSPNMSFAHPSTQEEETVRAMSSRSLTAFLSVFQSTWGRTPLKDGVEASERAQRHEAIEAGLVERLIQCYWRLLSEREQLQLKHRVAAEQQRVAAIEARQAAQDAAFRRATGAKSAEVLKQEQLEAEGAEALHTVHRQRLAERHRQQPDDAAMAHLKSLRQAIERTDEWFGHEADKRAIRREKEAAAATALSPTAGPRPPNEAGGRSPGGESEIEGPAAGGGGGASRMEALRARRLRELELAWQELQITYAQRMLLHDKWNAADLKAVDRAAKLYDECARAVADREASVEEICAIENATIDGASASTKQPQPSQPQQQAQQSAGKSAEVDERQRVVRRHQAFSEMCAAGQRCEVAAKRLRAETGDTLYFRDYVYLDKLRDDFTAVSKLLRASGAVSSKGARAAAAAASGGGRD